MNPYLLQHLLTNAAERHPEKEAVALNEQSITYGNLEKRTNQVGKALIRMGVKKGDRVGLIFDKGIEAIIAIFSILKVGASYVPIDPSAPMSRAKYIISNCEIECLLTSNERAVTVIPDLCKDSALKNVFITGEPIGELRAQCKALECTFWAEIFQTESESYQDSDVTDTYPSYVLYTSGSTGLPKGVVISHLNSLTFVNMAADFFRINTDDRLCSHAPLHFDLSVFDIFVAVKTGATIVLVPEYLSIFPIKLAQYINDKRISVWNSVSSVLSLLADRGKLESFSFDPLRLVLFSGDVLPTKYLRKVKARIPRAQFINVYGQTEANSSTFYHINEMPDDDTWRIPIGKAFPNFEVFALGENSGIIRRPGDVGELFVSGSTVALGYWRDNERTSQHFVHDPRPCSSQNRIYKTGDLVTIDKDGNYVFLGRKDQQVKSRGYRIQMNEIEITLNSHRQIKEAVVIAVPDELIGNRIISYVSLVDGIELSEVEILDFCCKLIPQYMLPEKIISVNKLPRTPTGKIDRNLLQRRAECLSYP